MTLTWWLSAIPSPRAFSHCSVLRLSQSSSEEVNQDWGQGVWPTWHLYQLWIFRTPNLETQAHILPLAFEVWQIAVSSMVIWLFQFKQLFTECLAHETVNIVHFKRIKLHQRKSLNKQGRLCPQWANSTPHLAAKLEG